MSVPEIGTDFFFLIVYKNGNMLSQSNAMLRNPDESIYVFLNAR